MSRGIVVRKELAAAQSRSIQSGQLWAYHRAPRRFLHASLITKMALLSAFRQDSHMKQILLSATVRFLLFISLLVCVTIAADAAIPLRSEGGRFNVARAEQERLAAAPSELGPSQVTVKGRQLLVRRRNADGTLSPALPWVMRGVNWSPASQDTNTNKDDPNNANVRRAEFSKWAQVDLPLLKAMNVNTVRVFLAPGLDANGKAVLDGLYNNGIMVLLTEMTETMICRASSRLYHFIARIRQC